jgi:hypothetical protein
MRPEPVRRCDLLALGDLNGHPVYWAGASSGYEPGLYQDIRGVLVRVYGVDEAAMRRAPTGAAA